ncbi:hypothetical protein B0293_13995 [Amycolatopsis azurea DSM 43854]|uniref:OsmC family peroxiredoxin n=1 Tax=Amycolatopsis azurea DSM 43854 TaxID=1238180 RepID=A0ABX3JF99_9PSEU|nr:hypothetical protein B0293_13995 [Amycolatopsis azurea DSM 43854]
MTMQAGGERGNSVEWWGQVVGRWSVKASLRDPESLKEAFTDFRTSCPIRDLSVGSSGTNI